MSKTFVGLAMSSTMFKGDCEISRRVISADTAKEIISSREIISCCNASHAETLRALKERFSISVSAEGAPKVTLEPGDTLIVLSARFSRRLGEGERFTPEEVDSANFEFVEYSTWTFYTCPACGYPSCLQSELDEDDIYCPHCDIWRPKEG